MNIGTSLKTISKNQLCSFIGTGGYVELAENDVLSDGSIVTSAAVLPLLNSRNDKGEGILPPGYQRVEFLESNGTQYIDTGILPANNIGVRLLAGNTGPVRDAFPAGVNDATLSTRESFYLSRCIKGYAYAGRWGSTFWWTKYPSPVVPGTFISELNWLNSREMRVDNNGIISSYSPLSTFNYTTEKTIYLFGINGNETVGWRDGIYYCQISQEADIIQDLVPVIDTNGTPCMFDTVTKQPFYNEGTGQFRVGIATLQQVRELQLPDNTGNAVKTLYLSLPQEARTDFTAQKNLSYLTDSLNWIIDIQYRDGDIPADYTKADFLQSSGSQYIDTGIATNGEYTISCRLQVSSGGAVWGRACTPPREDYTGGQSWARFLAPSESNKGLWFYYNYVGSAHSNNASRPPMWDISQPHDWVAVEGEKTVILDGEIVKLSTQFNYDVNVDNPDQRTHYIFATNGVYEYGTGKAPMKLYSFIMQDENRRTVLDLVPVINTAGVPGMWDKVGKKFYKNDGDGAFIVGIKTLNDVRMLNNALPVVPDGSTYSITLSLPAEASTDAPAQKTLKDLAERGWNITVQYREDEIPAGYAKVAFLESSGEQNICVKAPELRYSQMLWSQEVDIQFLSDSKSLVGFKGRTGMYWGRFASKHVGVNEDAQSPTPQIEREKLIFTTRCTIVELSYAQHGEWQSTLAAADGSWKIQRNNLPGAGISQDQPFGLFRYGDDEGSTSYNPGSIRIWSCKCWCDSVSYDLIPVINTDGVPGMWDKVGKQFYENDGTGQFCVGLASKEAVRNLYLKPDLSDETTINLSVPAGAESDVTRLENSYPNYTFNVQYRS